MARIDKKFKSRVTVHYKKNGETRYLKTFTDRFESLDQVKSHVLAHGCKGYGTLDVAVYQPDTEYFKTFRMRS